MSERETTTRHVLDSDELDRVSREFEDRSPGEIVAWALERFRNRVALSCSFGGDGGTMLAHLVSGYKPPVPILFLDTGLLFAETYSFKRQLSDLLRLQVIDVIPQRTVEEQGVALGPRLWERDPDRCCFERKVLPMQKALEPFDAWLTGIRRTQTGDRAGAPIIAFDQTYNVIKINPLANTGEEEIADYLLRFDLPHNPLKDRGYLSIGCWPCTSRVGVGEDPRAGRWRGSGKTECGLHAIGQHSPEGRNL